MPQRSWWRLQSMWLNGWCQKWIWSCWWNSCELVLTMNQCRRSELRHGKGTFHAVHKIAWSKSLSPNLMPYKLVWKCWTIRLHVSCLLMPRWQNKITRDKKCTALVIWAEIMFPPHRLPCWWWMILWGYCHFMCLQVICVSVTSVNTTKSTEKLCRVSSIKMTTRQHFQKLHRAHIWVMKDESSISLSLKSSIALE